MVRLAAIRITILLTMPSSVLFAICPALCQQSERAAWNSLPDAPVAHEDVQPNLSGMANLGFETLRQQESALASGRIDWIEGSAALRADSFKEELRDGNEFRRELAELLRHPPNYHPSTNGSLMRRAASTALGTFFTRTPSGKNKLDTSYLLGVLSSAVIQTANRPYWNRPVSAPFSDFGSRVGNDAGMNLLHEFRPGLEQLLKNHTPKLISRIEASFERR